MDKNKKKTKYKIFDPIINTFFSIMFVLARVDLRGGGMHRLCSPAHSSGLTIRNSPEDQGRFESSPPRFNLN